MRAKSTMAALIVMLLCDDPRDAAATILMVTSAGDSGAGTLRQAILDAAPSGDTINFAPALDTISLFSGEMAIAKSLTIAGPGPARLRIQRVTNSGGPGFMRIFNISAGNVAISGVTIANGYAPDDQGGNIKNLGGTVTITNTTISTGRSGQSFGGGIANGCYTGACPPSTMTIVDSTIAGNAAVTAAGIYSGDNSMTTIRNSTITANVVQNGGGGGLYIDGGTVVITGSTISGNTALFRGAGISMPAGGSLTIRNSTITANVVKDASIGSAGGINAGPNGARLSSTIVARNSAHSDPDLSGLMITEGFNLIGDTSGISNPNPHPADQLDAEPLLGSLLDNGGPTFTHALLSGSTAIDRGIANGFAGDQRGLARTVDGASANLNGSDGTDIGAYEVQPDLLPGCNTVNRVVQNGSDADPASLRDVISKVCAGSIITFAPNVSVVTLTSGQLPISKVLAIRGPGAHLLSIKRSAGAASNFRIFDVGTNTIVTLSGLTIADGVNPGQQGGGLRNAGRLTLANVAVANNSARPGNGGGIYNTASGVLTITGSTISGNSVSSASGAGSGGGIHNFGGAITIVNSTLSGNSALGPGGNSDSGGGFWTNTGPVTLINTTITGNSADLGGGLRNGGVVTARNTIVALNMSPNGPDVYGPLTSEGFNIFGNSSPPASITPTYFTDWTNLDAGQVGLGPLQLNGGSTENHALLVGSYALDAGHASGYGIDQRGVPRHTDDPGIGNAIGGDGSDIGAFEVGVRGIDVDGNGTYDPFTDGVLLVRYLAGYTGTSLTENAIGLLPLRETPAQITAFLDDIKPTLDVDGDGRIDPLTDGLMLVRYMRGLRGAALVAGVPGTSPARSGTQIDNYIESLVP